MNTNREAERQFANRNSYFWLPCPLCGEEFGGHEKSFEGVPINGDPNHRQMVCPKPECQKKARELTEEAERQNPSPWVPLPT